MAPDPQRSPVRRTGPPSPHESARTGKRPGDRSARDADAQRLGVMPWLVTAVVTLPKAPAATPKPAVRVAVPKPAVAPAATPRPGTIGDYVIQRGDSLASIAARRHIAGGYRVLLAKNPGLKNPNRIYPGQHLT